MVGEEEFSATIIWGKQLPERLTGTPEQAGFSHGWLWLSPHSKANILPPMKGLGFLR